MGKKEQKPAIRFRGFNDAWEQRKLGDEAIEILAGGDIDKEKAVENGKYPIYANALTNNGIVGYYDDYYRVKAPAVTVTGRGEVGHAQARMFDFTPVVRLLAIRSAHDCYFLENAINEHGVIVESTGVPQLTVPQLSAYNIFFPKDVEEETKIGQFLHNIDNLITLHQRKYDKLVTVKKSMLEKMFPRDGADVPEIRFDGFTEPWEQCKVIDVAPLQRGFDLPTSQMEEGSYPVIMSNGIGGYHSAYKAKGPGVVTGRSGTIGRLHYIENNYWPHNTALWATDFKGNLPKFVYHLYQRLDLSHFGSGSGVPTLNRNDVHDAIVFIPSVDEQTKISNVLDRIDNLITLHQRKLEKLKTIKKSMLEKMFV